MSNLPPLVGQMNLQLEGRVVAITGAASGIGFATARAVGLLGGRAILGDFNEAGLTVAVDELQNLGMRVESKQLDVTDPVSVQAFIDFSVGQGRLDGVVTSAGTTSMTPILDLTLDEWHRVLTTNLTGTFLVAQYGARAMAKLGRPGSIVTVSSTFGAAPQARGAHLRGLQSRRNLANKDAGIGTWRPWDSSQLRRPGTYGEPTDAHGGTGKF